jgi:hypothetical protein
LKLFLRILTVVLIVAVAAVTIVFANRGEKAVLSDLQAQQSASPSPSPSEEPSPSASPSAYSGPYNPLSGLPSDAETANRRPYAIMFDNIKVAQPLLGISKADILFEIPVEGGITRMMALFQDVKDAGLIGSVRSARPYFVEVARGYDAIYIHAGGSSQAYDMLQSTGIDHLDGVHGKDDIFYRDPARKKAMGYEHSLVTSGDLIAQFLPTYKLRLEHDTGYFAGMAFADSAVPADGTDAGSITVHFASSRTTGFEYDAAAGLYKVSQFGKAYLDGNSGQQLGVTNVLILTTDIFNISGDTAGRLKVGITGSGDGTFFCGGKSLPVTWTKKNAAAPYSFSYKDGTPLVFERGATYICVVADTMKVDVK